MAKCVKSRGLNAVTLVLRLVGLDYPCRLGTEMVALVIVVWLAHILLPVPYTP